MQASAPAPPGRRRGDVVGVGGRGAPEHLAVDAGARAGARSSSSSTSAAPPSAITKPSRRRSKGRDIPELDSAVMLREGGHADLGHGRLGPAGHDDVAAAGGDQAGGGCRSPACRRRRPSRPSRTAPASRAASRWRPRRRSHHHGDEEGRHTPRPLLDEHLDLLSASVSRPPTPVPKMTPARAGSRSSRRRRRGPSGRRDGELLEAVGPSRLFDVEPGARVEVAHPSLALGRRAAQAVEEGVDADPAARHDPDTGDRTTTPAAPAMTAIRASR